MKIAPTFTARSVLFNFAPWIVYSLLSAAGLGRWAYLGGLTASVCQIVPQWRKRRVKILDGVTVLFFFAGSFSALALHSALFLKNSSRLIWGTFALAAWGSLVAGSPFTGQYARDAVPREYWDNPGFRRVNGVITAVWGGVFVVNAILTCLTWRSEMWFPILSYAGVVFGIVFTNRYPQWVLHRRLQSDQRMSR